MTMSIHKKSLKTVVTQNKMRSPKKATLTNKISKIVLAKNRYQWMQALSFTKN